MADDYRRMRGEPYDAYIARVEEQKRNYALRKAWLDFQIALMNALGIFWLLNKLRKLEFWVRSCFRSRKD